MPRCPSVRHLHHARPRAGRQQGFSLLEMMIVLAIIGVLTSVGYVIAKDIVPQYRTRMAAMDFANHIEQCRNLAVSSGRRCRIVMLAGEIATQLEDLDSNTGKYQIDLEIDGGGWDTLPVDTITDSVDDNASTGVIDISSTSANGFKHVAILDWGTILGPGSDNDDAIVFDTRGFVANPTSDFTSGLITITFVNKVAESRGSPDRWAVHITRAGVAHLDSSRSTKDDNVTSGGTASNTTYDPGGVFGAP